jgi:hypothetical protein
MPTYRVFLSAMTVMSRQRRRSPVPPMMKRLMRVIVMATVC